MLGRMLCSHATCASTLQQLTHAAVCKDTRRWVLILFNNPVAVAQFLAGKGKGTLVELSGVHAVPAPQGFDAYLAVRFDGPATVLTMSHDYSIVPAGVPLSPCTPFEEVRSLHTTLAAPLLPTTRRPRTQFNQHHDTC